MDRYPNGRSKELQSAAGKRYRESQAAQRDWLRDVARYMGLEPHELLTNSAAAVAELLRTEYGPATATDHTGYAS